MKRQLLLICAFVMFFTNIVAQSKVAVLDIVDRESQLEYNSKLMLRSYIAEAVTKTNGYEVYDYTDLGEVIDDYEFRRTGNLSAKDIQKIGQIAGVQHILIIEASRLKSNKLFLTAKLINTTTAHMESATNITIKTQKKQMELCGKKIANTLLNDSKGPKLVRLTKDERKTLHKKEFVYGDMEMNKKELFTFLSERCREAYKIAMKAKRLHDAGWGVFACTFMGGVPIYIPCLVQSEKEYDHAVDCFNSNCNK